MYFMKVLLLGEYSGFYNSLKDGLEELGVDVYFVSNGDSMCAWKQIDGYDSRLYPPGGQGVIRYFNQYIMPYVYAERFKDYDIVQVINPVIYNSILDHDLVERIVDRNRNFVLSAAGDDCILYEAYKNGCFDYFTFDDDEYAHQRYSSERLSAYEKRLIRKADAVIPCSYDYYKAYKAFDITASKTTEVIPLPLNCNKIEYQDNLVRDRVVYFHGISRETAKGSAYIIEALDKLKRNYPNDVEIIINTRMPFADYVKAMQRANIIVDQCKAYSYGMNACIAMAQGRIVLSGNNPESYNNGSVIPPVIWISPDVDRIYCELEKLLELKRSYQDMGINNRKFVEQYHGHITVASEYLSVWKEL